jgi:two-component system, response regulator PdtaR
MKMQITQAKRLDGAVIMVVDDEFLIALDTERTLRDAGAEVVGPFTTLIHSLRAAAGERISLAIVDFRLSSNQTTLPLIAALTARGVPVIVYSGQRLRDGVPGASAVLPKPISQRALIETVAKFLTKKV